MQIKQITAVVIAAFAAVTMMICSPAHGVQTEISAEQVRTAAFSEQQSAEEIFALSERASHNFELVNDDDTARLLTLFAGSIENTYRALTIDEYKAVFSDKAYNYQLQRAEYAKMYAAESGQTFTDVSTLFTVNSVSDSGQISLYEWSMIEYNKGGEPDYCGFGFNHEISVKDGVIYDDIVTDDAFEPCSADEQISVSSSKSYYAAGGAVNYSADKAVKYADTYWQNYNSAYKNLNDLGGDCANFVSQCLYAGGFSMTDDWYYKSSGWSRAWTYVSDNLSYFSKFGSFIKNPSAANVLKGNPVYYYKSSGAVHMSICVGTNSYGDPIINAHNNDRYHVDWELGGTKYFPGGNATIKLNTTSAVTTAAPTTKAPTTTAVATAEPTTFEPVIKIQPATVIYEDGTVHTAGDANGDGKVTAADVLFIRKHLASWQVNIDKYLADVNADGKVTAADVLIIRKYLAGWSVALILKRS